METSRLRKIVAILLTVLLLVTVTASAVSAYTPKNTVGPHPGNPLFPTEQKKVKAEFRPEKPQPCFPSFP